MPPKAPRPGTGKRAKATETFQQIATISFRGESHTLAINNVPIREKIAYLQQVGISYEALTFRDEVYSESIAPLVWLSRRAHGERSLTFDKFLETWPNDMGISEISVKVSEPDEDATDPEA